MSGDEAPLISELMTDSSDAAPQERRNQWIDHLQDTTNYMAHILSLISISVVYWWTLKLGGFSWTYGHSKQTFNWHPMLMIVAFCFMTVATLAYRFPKRLADRNHVKLTHAIAWMVAALSAFMALLAVFRSHNDPISGYTANLYSTHSWMGCLTILLFIGQFLSGFYTFWPGLAFNEAMSPTTKEITLVIHSFVGPLIYCLTALTILLGIQEKEGFVGCSYTVHSSDLFPPIHFLQIPSTCLISHLLAILVLATALCTFLAMFDFRSKMKEN